MSLAQRATNMLKASIISDAAAMPLHWIYNQNEVATKVGAESSIFYPTPSCPFYSYPSGVLSPYGAEALPYVSSIAEVGAFDRDHAAQKAFDFFKTYPDESVNGYVGRLNHVPKTFIANREAGKSWDECNVEDSQANGIAKVPLIVARYGGSPALVERIETMVSLQQKSVLSVESSVLVGKLLERILFKGEKPAQAVRSLFADADIVHLSDWQRNVLSFVTSEDRILEWQRFANSLGGLPAPAQDAYRNHRISGGLLTALFSARSFSDAVAAAKLADADREVLETAVAEMVNVPASELSLDVKVVAQSIGLSCALPAALLNSLYIMLHAKDLAEATELNIVVAGDNCSRAMVIGAAFGAHSEVPADWISKVQGSWWNPTAADVEKIVASNPAFA